MPAPTCTSAKTINCDSGCGAQTENGVDTTCKGCKDGCNAACAKPCYGDCYTNCGGGCSSGCADACKGGNSTERNCLGCQTTCGLGCGAGCTSGCNKGLSGACGDCTNKCRGCGNCGGCANACSGGCSDTCNDTCKDTCTGHCKGGCLDGCGDTCTHSQATSAYTSISLGLNEVITAQDVADLETLVYAETQRRGITPTVSLIDGGVEQNKLTLRLDMDAIYNDLTKIQNYPRNPNSPYKTETVTAKEQEVATKDKVLNYIHVVTSLYGVMIPGN